MADLKLIACDAIDVAADDLHALSDDIWNHPELGLSETHAHQVLTGFLDQRGFQVCRFVRLKLKLERNKAPPIKELWLHYQAAIHLRLMTTR